MDPIHLRTTTTALRLRSRPEVASDSDTGQRLLEGQLAEAWGESLDGRWYFVVAPGGTGWASKLFLEPVDPPAGDAIADARARLDLRRDLIPPSAPNRPGTHLDPQWITIHNTANRGPGANAEMHRRYLLGSDARDRQVSWHFTVDDTQVIQHVPTDEVAWHAGPRGNAASIGIEIAEHAGIDQDAADDRAALLTALLLAELEIPLAHVRTHKSWTGKECPRVLLQTPGGWERFLARVAEHFGRL
jgi:hypothetical protein